MNIIIIGKVAWLLIPAVLVGDHFEKSHGAEGFWAGFFIAGFMAWILMRILYLVLDKLFDKKS